MSQTYSTWPFECPNSWQEKANPALVRSELDDGYPKVRRRFTKTWREYQVQWRLDVSKFQAFSNFVEVDCGAGSIPFYITHPITGSVITVRWKEPPQTSAGVDTLPTFDISGTLEMMFS
jgi:hypothetical protein